MTAVARQSATQSEPRRRLLLASDRRDLSADLARILAGVAEVQIISTTQLPDAPAQDQSDVVVDINLRTPDSEQAVRRKLLGGGYQPIPRLFVLADELHHGSMQAWALGATDTIARPFDARDLLARIRAAFPDASETTETARDEAMTKGRVSIILIETPANPTNSLVDVAMIRRIADAISWHFGKRETPPEEFGG